MKKVLASVVALGCFAAAGSALAGMPAATGVNGSLHDMNKFVGGNADTMGRVCVFCHTPHHAQSNNGLVDLTNSAPLWNRDTTNLTFTPYVWVTPMNQDPNTIVIAGNSDSLAGPSRLCMSCHDGSIAVDEHGPAFAQAGSRFVSARANLGQDLTQTHPIGFVYETARVARNAGAGNGDQVTGDTEIVDSNSGFAKSITITADLAANQGLYNTVDRTAKKRIKDVLHEGVMTCASCHEVHNKENATQEPYTGVVSVNGPSDTSKAPNYFLYAKQANSLICLSCHVK